MKTAGAFLASLVAFVQALLMAWDAFVPLRAKAAACEALSGRLARWAAVLIDWAAYFKAWGERFREWDAREPTDPRG